MTAGDCLGHTWLKRKPPPPSMFLEESKENLKTYVETIHTSSPFLLCDSLSNGSINDVQLISSPPEIPKPKAGSPDKTLQLFELAPERSNGVNEQTKNILEEQNFKLKNEINLEKSVHPNIIIQTEPPPEEEMPSNSESPSTTVQFENKENCPRKLIKTDSFKELPRKFSISALDGSRELPRRSSLSRAEKGKIELKRENFVTFIGPREIKPIDPLSPDIKHAVEELTNFIKLNIEASTSSKAETAAQIIESTTSNICKTVNNEKEITLNTEKIKEESFSQVRSKSDINPIDIVTSNKTIVNNEETKLSEKSVSLNHHMISSTTSNLSTQKSQERVKKKDEIPAFLRPADYIKSIKISRDSSLSSFKSLESKTLGSVGITGLLDKKTTADIPPSSVSSFSKELPNLKPTSVPTPMDAKESYSSIRNQSFVETIYKRQTGKIGFSKASSFDNEVKAKLKSTENVKTWHSTAIRNDVTLPRKFIHGIKTNESVNNPKESPSSSISDTNKGRASSLDPTSAGYSTTGTNEQPFQSRFLRSSQINTARCSSETPVSKYEEFKNRYSNYKELASDNDKLFKKSFVERTPPGKKEKIVETSAPIGRGDAAENISTSSISSKSSFISQSSSTSSNFLTRQRFKLTEQQRDSYNKFDSVSRLNKTESVVSSFRSEKERSCSTVPGTKESITQKHSHTSTQNSVSNSKLAAPGSCPTSPQKSV